MLNGPKDRFLIFSFYVNDILLVGNDKEMIQRVVIFHFWDGEL